MILEFYGRRYLLVRQYLFFKTAIISFFLFFILSCSHDGKLNPSPQKFTKADSAHLSSLKAELASSKNFYLELSIREKKIYLLHSGEVLRTYPFSEINLERKSFAFFKIGKSLNFNNTVFRNGELSPERKIERIKVIPGDESTRPTPEAPGIIPPTMEEIIAVPPVYHLNFNKSFSIRFILIGEIPGKRMEINKLKLKWNDFLAGLGLKNGPDLRLRIKMDAREGASFFRSCPEKTTLLILP